MEKAYPLTCLGFGPLEEREKKQGSSVHMLLVERT